MIAFFLAIASIIVAYLEAAHWNFGFIRIFLHPADYILFLAVPALISSRHGLKVTLRSLLRIDACSHEFRSTALLMTGYVSAIGVALGIVLTLGSIAAGPEVVGSMVARSLVPTVLGGCLSAWIMTLPKAPISEEGASAGFAALGIMGFGALTSLLIFMLTLWIIGFSS